VPKLDSLFGIVISGGNISRSALAVCAALGIVCERAPAIFLSTNGKGRCPNGTAAQGRDRVVIGTHLATIDVWSRLATRQSPSFVFEADVALPVGVRPERVRALVHSVLSVHRHEGGQLLKLGHWDHVATHAYWITPRAAATLARRSRELFSSGCDPHWPADQAVASACWPRGSHARALRCANAGPNIPNPPQAHVRFGGILKQMKPG